MIRGRRDARIWLRDEYINGPEGRVGTVRFFSPPSVVCPVQAAPFAMVSEQWILKGPEVNLNLPDANLGAFLIGRLRGRAQPRVQVDAETEEAVNAEEMVQRALSVAAELTRRGIKKGDVVVTAFDNCLEYTYVFLGTMYIGAVFAPINPGLAPGDLQHMLRVLEPRVVLSVARVAAALREGLPADVPVVVPEERTEWPAFLAHRGAALDLPSDPLYRADDTAVIMCSSGTTGPPKGVQLTHRNLQAVMALSGLDSLTKLERPPVHVLVSPGFWSSGFFSTLISLHINITQILLRGFDVETLLRTVEKYKANILALSPFQIVAIAKHPGVEKHDLSSLLFISYAGAPLSLVMKGKAEKRLNRPLAQYYGLTECLFTVVPGPKNALKPGTVGVPAPNTMIKVVDVETGKTNGPNVEGEICFKGPNVFKGYYRNPEATATVIDSEGWMHSGDIGFFDDDGYFFVHDRIKELIKQKGIQVIPTDIESVLLSHPAVKDTAVVGIEHDLEQEQAVAFVVKQPGASVTEEDLINLVKEQLPEYKWLNGGVRFAEAIPRTASGKVIRRELRQRARLSQGPPSPTQGTVRKICQDFEKLSSQALKDMKRSSHRSVL